MSRVRIVLGSMVGALAVLVLSAGIMAQDPTGGQGGGGQGGGGGGGRGGRGGGPGGPGGFGGGGPGGPGGFGFGGPGGPGGFGGPGGGGLMALALNPAVQEDGKYTDKQKEQLREANDAIEKKRQEAFKSMAGARGNRGNATKGAPKDAANPDAAKTKDETAKTDNPDPATADNTKGARTKATTGKTAAKGANGKAARGAGGQGPGGNPDDPNGGRPDRTAMFEQMQAIQKQTDETLKKILKKEQYARLSEIDLRRQGPMAVLRPDIAKKLNITDDQMAMIRETQGQMRTQQREMGKAQRDSMNAIRTQMQAQGLVPAQGGNRGGGGAGATKGGQGGRGGNNGPIDPEVMKKFLADNPELKSQVDQFQKEGDQLKDQAIAAIAEVLTSKQKINFNKMLGKPFNVERLTNPNAPADDVASKDGDTDKKSSSKKASAKKTSSKKKAA